ncbi:hypothetical protein [Halomonas sp. 3D7M]|uniref:hypothetical protein n=1 Tax=Halomonas sp. 3D7M TaxID=2742617 RepID=UPI001867EFBF|nr:hypothetical protein [Halomonas sp. 3D7M]
MNKPINTPDKLQELIESDGVSERDKYAAYVCKAYYSYIYDLKNHYGFQLKRILESINLALGLNGDDVIAYQAFRSSMRRIEAKRGQPRFPVLKATETNEEKAKIIRAHEKISNEKVKNRQESDYVELSNEWLELLKKHPVMKKQTILTAIENGLTYDEAEEADSKGIRKFAEIVNTYCARKFT